MDGFQGQERDVIVISMVRSNDEGQIGFLRDLRRMNVAITRARMKLIIIGNQKTMTRHTFYRQLWRYIKGLSGEENQWSGEENQWSGEEELLSGEEKEGYSDNTDESTYDTLESNGLVEEPIGG